MAYLIRQRKTYYVLDGRRVPKGTPGAEKIRDKSAKFYGVGIPGLPSKKRVPLARDRETAKRMLADAVRAAERGETWMPDREAAKLPLAEHLVAFEEDLRLGLVGRARRRRRPPCEEHVLLTVQRIRDALEDCGFKQAGDLNADAPAKLARNLRDRRATKRTNKPGVRSGISAQTAAFILAAVRRFVHWLATAKRLAVKADLFDGIPGFDPANNRIHLRREVSTEELARLIETTREASRYRGLTGTDRAMLYLVAFATGYRAEELSKLRPEWFELDADPPSACLPAEHTKNKRAARQPLPPGVVNLLTPYLANKKPGKPVWPGTWIERPVQMLRLDLAAAGVPYCVHGADGPRYADFHALRHSFVSALAATGASPKELQELARHSDPRLTLGVYTHVRTGALAAAVARLTIPGAHEAHSALCAPDLSRLSRAELEARIVELEAELRTLRDTPRDTPRLDSPDERKRAEAKKPTIRKHR